MARCLCHNGVAALAGKTGLTVLGPDQQAILLGLLLIARLLLREKEAVPDKYGVPANRVCWLILSRISKYIAHYWSLQPSACQPSLTTCNQLKGTRVLHLSNLC